MAKAAFNIHHFDTLPSTQILARQWCETGRAKPGDVIHADIQTAGYGRRQRGWRSPPGNLSFTLIQDFDEVQLSWLGYAMGLALYDAAAALLPDPSILRLKWPNDLMLDGRKLSGLLLEVADSYILIGAGLNLATAPSSDQPVAALSDYASDVPPARDFLENVLTAYRTYHNRGKEAVFAGLRELWLMRAIWMNQLVTARLADGRTIQGRFINLDSRGALVLEDEGAHHVITTADIFLS